MVPSQRKKKKACNPNTPVKDGEVEFLDIHGQKLPEAISIKREIGQFGLALDGFLPGLASWS